jgi:multisubunit Na+/H+ antiporter MnhC subunit
MTIAITTGVIAFVAVALFLLVARRVFRLAFKLAFVGVLVVLLIVGASVGWWRGWFGSSSRPDRKPAQINQKANSNRRAPVQ